MQDKRGQYLCFLLKVGMITVKALVRVFVSWSNLTERLRVKSITC